MATALESNTEDPIGSTAQEFYRQSTRLSQLIREIKLLSQAKLDASVRTILPRCIPQLYGPREIDVNILKRFEFWVAHIEIRKTIPVADSLENWSVMGVLPSYHSAAYWFANQFWGLVVEAINSESLSAQIEEMESDFDTNVEHVTRALQQNVNLNVKTIEEAVLNTPLPPHCLELLQLELTQAILVLHDRPYLARSLNQPLPSNLDWSDEEVNETIYKLRIVEKRLWKTIQQMIETNFPGKKLSLQGCQQRLKKFMAHLGKTPPKDPLGRGRKKAKNVSTTQLN